jgi:hypothetical protein
MAQSNVNIKALSCPNCGSTDVTLKQELADGLLLQCTYCNSASLVTVDESPEATTRSPVQKQRLKLAKLLPAEGEGEFGLGNGKLLLGLTAAGSVILYLAGWLLEDMQYLLATNAVIVWAGILPFWLLMGAAIWRTSRTVWPIGLVIAALIFLFHLGLTVIIKGRFNDDYAGIGAMFAGFALAGWLAGRWLHLGIRIIRVRRVDQNSIG